MLRRSVLFGAYRADFVRHVRVNDDGVPTLNALLGHRQRLVLPRSRAEGGADAMAFGRHDDSKTTRAPGKAYVPHRF
ncbi:MAG: hypothetical protein EOO73_26855 [Myxococcales bacterium]|nr:MAG: hypothetical protein EOO73_26855 [Myxococcales bacterium]